MVDIDLGIRRHRHRRESRGLRMSHEQHLQSILKKGVELYLSGQHVRIVFDLIINEIIRLDVLPNQCDLILTRSAWLNIAIGDHERLNSFRSVEQVNVPGVAFAIVEVGK